LGFGSWLGGFKNEIGIRFRPTLVEIAVVIRRVRGDPFSLLGAVMVLFFMMVSLLAPLLAPPSRGVDPYICPYDGPTIGDLKIYPPPSPPSSEHPFGTLQGFDIYYGCIWGTRTTFRVGILVIFIALAFGLFIGCTAGYLGGLVDELLMRLADIFFAFPGILLAIVLVMALPSEWTINLGFIRFAVTLSQLDKLVLALALVGWPSYARVVRSEMLRVKQEDYVEAAKAVGCSGFRVLVQHILPNSMYPILTMAFLNFGKVVLFAATLSFLGFGPETGYADWATIISHARNWIVTTPQDPFRFSFTWITPSMFIFAFILGWSLLGDELRDILDPTLRRI
jgi:peptide/nickel transport system permease protein